MVAWPNNGQSVSMARPLCTRSHSNDALDYQCSIRLTSGLATPAPLTGILAVIGEDDQPSLHHQLLSRRQ